MKKAVTFIYDPADYSGRGIRTHMAVRRAQLDRDWHFHKLRDRTNGTVVRSPVKAYEDERGKRTLFLLTFFK
jgi:hypothetical protein